MHREARGRAWAAVLLAVCLALACEAFVVPIAKLRKPKDVHNEWRSAPIALSRPVLAPPPLDLTKVSSTLSLTPEQQPTEGSLDEGLVDLDGFEPCEVMGLCQASSDGDLVETPKDGGSSSSQSAVPLLRRVLSQLVSSVLSVVSHVKQSVASLLGRLRAGATDLFDLLSFLLPNNLRFRGRVSEEKSGGSGGSMSEEAAAAAPKTLMAAGGSVAAAAGSVLSVVSEVAAERVEEAVAPMELAAAMVTDEVELQPSNPPSEEADDLLALQVAVQEEEAVAVVDEPRPEEAAQPPALMAADEPAPAATTTDSDDQQDGSGGQPAAMPIVEEEAAEPIVVKEEEVEAPQVVLGGVLSWGGQAVSEEERAAVSGLRAKLSALPASSVAWVSDVDLLRYVRQSSGRGVEGAYSRLLKTLGWREEEKVDMLADLDMDADSPLSKELFWLNARDKSGNPVLVFRTSAHEPGAYSPQMFTRHIVHLLELGRKEYGLGKDCQVTLLVDRVGSGLRNQEPGLVRAVVPVLQEHYPEMLSVAHVAPVNWFLYLIWVVFRFVLDPNTAKRINLITGDYQSACRQYVEESALPQHMGGQLDQYDQLMATN